MKKTIYKIISVILALSLLFVMTSCGKSEKTDTSTEAVNNTAETETAVQQEYTDTASSLKKSEVVYINSDYYGTPGNVIVSDWLHTDKACVKVNDVSDLTDITNAKGNELPSISDKNVVWNMGTTDLYYRGSTDKALPVSIAVKYYLNDVQVAVEDLAGKSGKIKIAVSVKNTVSTEKTIDGKKVTVYNPILVAGGMILPEDKFTNIAVDGGQAISDGTKQIVVLASAPGVTETLGLNDYDIDKSALKFPSEFTISADVTEFELGNMYFAAIPFSNLNANIEIPDKVTDIESSISTISGIVDSVYSLNPDELIKMLQNNKDGINELAGAVGDAAKLYESNKKLISVLKKYMTEDNIKKLKKLVTDLDEADLQQYQELLSNPLFKRFFNDLPTLAADLDEIMPLITSLNEDLSDPEVKASLEKLPETLNQLSAIIDTVDENKELIDALMNLMSKDNLAKITDVINAVQSADIDSMITDYSKLADNAEDIIARFEAMMDYGNTYKIFSAAPKGAQTSVTFVFNTPSITPATAKESTTAEAGLQAETEKKGIWETVKGWF